MAKITALKSQKNGGRINVFLDNRYSFSIYESALVDYGLYKGKEVSIKEINKIKNHDKDAKCLSVAYRLLSFRPRSESELRMRLEEKYAEKTIEKIIKILKQNSYLDDVAFVDFWLEHRMKSRGPSLVKSELLKKGVSKEIIIEKLLRIKKSEILTNALNLINQRAKYRGLSKAEAYKKISPYLARRGYSYEIIKEVIKKLY